MSFTRGTLAAEVDRIIRLSGDNESAHGEEDILHRDLINEFCPKWVVAEVQRLTESDWARWYA